MGRSADMSLSGDRLLLVHQLHVLNVDGLFDLLSSFDRRFNECLSCAELTDSAGFLEFPLEFLESLLYVLTFFYRYYNHRLITSFYLRVQR